MTKILVIEDEDQIREEVLDWLQFEGYMAQGAANGRVGLALIQNDIPDLILCDIAMPEINGYEVLLELRSNPQTMAIPFIFLTAAADRESMRTGMQCGADDYITKPFTHPEVLGTIQARLERRKMQEHEMQQQIEFLEHALSHEQEENLFKSRLVSALSHDFRNPLSLILIASNMLRNHVDRLSPERKQLSLDRIDEAVHELTSMLDEMLSMAKRTSE